MADPVKKEDTKDPVAELINRLEAGKKATERLDELEKKRMMQIEQMVGAQSGPADAAAQTSTSSDDNAVSDDSGATSVYISDDDNQPV